MDLNHNFCKRVSLHQKIKIGVMGSSSLQGVPKSVIETAREVGREVARHNCILITGATTGLPLEAAKGAKEEGGFVIGISPAARKDEHLHRYGLTLEHHDVVIYSGFGYKGRNVVNIRASDAIIFIRGSTGTLNEFTIAYDDTKLIGIMKGTGGMADSIKNVLKICSRSTGSIVIEEKKPQRLVERLLERVEHEFPRSAKAQV